MLRVGARLPNLKDSKALTRLQREQFAKRILAVAESIGYGQVPPAAVDRLGVASANELAFRLALDALRPRPDYVLADYFSITDYRCPVEGVLHGDIVIRSIAAASILAKVYRDKLMFTLAATHPQYGFESHVGYGTAAHEKAIRMHGLTKIHRQSFCKKFLT